MGTTSKTNSQSCYRNNNFETKSIQITSSLPNFYMPAFPTVHVYFRVFGLKQRQHKWDILDLAAQTSFSMHVTQPKDINMASVPHTDSH